MKLTFKFLVIIFIAFFSLSCSEQGAIDSEIIENESFFIPADKEKEILILEEINSYRISQGLTPFLKLDAIKSQTHQHTILMADMGEIFHANFVTRSNFLKSQIGATAVGENLAKGFVLPSDLLQGWLNSEKHKKNIEGNFTHFNISAEQNEEGIWFYTNIFIKK